MSDNAGIKALVKAQTEMERARAASNNPHFKSKYADLSQVQDACLPALHANGFAVLQPLGRDQFGDYVETTFVHESGWCTGGRAYLIIGKNDMQGYGSAVTYARRYGLASLAGITDEDDDGNAAVKSRQQKPEPTQATGQSLSRKASPAGPRETPPPAAAPAGGGAPTPMLTKAMGEAIVLGLDNCPDATAIDAYMEALARGPNGFAASHEKIVAAAKARREALRPIPFGELPVPGTEARR